MMQLPLLRLKHLEAIGESVPSMTPWAGPEPPRAVAGQMEKPGSRVKNKIQVPRTPSGHHIKELPAPMKQFSSWVMHIWASQWHQ